MSYKCCMCDNSADLVERWVEDSNEERYLMTVDYEGEVLNFAVCFNCVEEYKNTKMLSDSVLQPISEYLVFYAMVKL